ncbi:MAG TPA: hypothetical protein PK205_10315 [Promineifilum sp.]|nr:hypothetical protein [Promineifilum sp.]HRQ13688.1 hypothetical protein [Promineifilum sp.]
MKRFTLLLILAALLAACDNAPQDTAASLPTPLPPVPTADTTTGQQPTATGAALATLPISPTAEPSTELPTLTPLATDAPPPSPEVSPTVESPTAEPTAVSLFAPGQQDGGSLAAGQATAYLVDARRFQPLILFVEPTNELNIALAAYVGDQTQQTMPEGVTPPVAADNTMAGRPEILVLSPEADGLYTFVVRAVAGEGSFAVRLYDMTTPASGVAVQQPDALAAGEAKSYTVTSRGPRPVIAAADPTDQSDLALDILGADGTLLTTANYSGPGGVETAYVLPLGETTYTVRIREANGGPAAFQILVITLE